MGLLFWRKKSLLDLEKERAQVIDGLESSLHLDNPPAIPDRNYLGCVRLYLNALARVEQTKRDVSGYAANREKAREILKRAEEISVRQP